MLGLTHKAQIKNICSCIPKKEGKLVREHPKLDSIMHQYESDYSLARENLKVQVEFIVLGKVFGIYIPASKSIQHVFINSEINHHYQDELLSDLLEHHLTHQGIEKVIYEEDFMLDHQEEQSFKSAFQKTTDIVRMFIGLRKIG